MFYMKFSPEILHLVEIEGNKPDLFAGPNFEFASTRKPAFTIYLSL